MKKKKDKCSSETDFKEQTPGMQIEQEKKDLLYEKAFYSAEEETDNEYAKNTTTWD